MPGATATQGFGTGTLAALRVDPSPAPEPIFTPAPVTLQMTRSAPVAFTIASIGVESALMDLGLMDDGSLEVPPTAYPAGWFPGAPTPGQLGPAIIAGHVDYAGETGVFHDLHTMEPGAEVIVERADGTTAVFVVTRVEQYAKDAFPTEEVYGNLDHAGLRLITCGGEFNWDAGSHRDNIVVFAELDRVEPAAA